MLSSPSWIPLHEGQRPQSGLVRFLGPPADMPSIGGNPQGDADPRASVGYVQNARLRRMSRIIICSSSASLPSIVLASNPLDRRS